MTRRRHARRRCGRHRLVIHPGHAGVVHSSHGAVAAMRRHVHAHISHRQDGPLAQGRDRGAHAGARRQGGARHAGAVDGLGDQGVGAVFGRLHDDVVGFSIADLEFVHLDRTHILAVRRHDRELQARNADIEDHLGRGVDEAQPYPLTGTEEPGPVVLGTMAIDQEGLRRAGDVGDVRRVHEHLRPLDPLGERLVPARQQARDRLALVVEDPGLLLQSLEDQVRVHLAVIGEHDDMLAFGDDRVGPGRLDHDRRVMALGFLERGVAVIPVGPRLDDRELVDEGLPRRDAGEAHAGHAIHLKRDEEAMPVDGALFLQRVGHRNPRALAFP